MDPMFLFTDKVCIKDSNQQPVPLIGRKDYE
jgi:hypothetical protein